MTIEKVIKGEHYWIMHKNKAIQVTVEVREAVIVSNARHNFKGKICKPSELFASKQDLLNSL
jgi:hypothetical protein